MSDHLVVVEDRDSANQLSLLGPTESLVVEDESAVYLLTVGMQGPPGPPGVDAGTHMRQVFTAVQASYPLEQVPILNTDVAILNGLILAPGEDYTLVGSTVTLLQDFLPGDILQVLYRY